MTPVRDTPPMVLLRRWKLVLAVAVGALILLYVVGFVIFNLGGEVPGTGEGDPVSLGSTR